MRAFQPIRNTGETSPSLALSPVSNALSRRIHACQGLVRWGNSLLPSIRSFSNAVQEPNVSGFVVSQCLSVIKVTTLSRVHRQTPETERAVAALPRVTTYHAKHRHSTKRITNGSGQIHRSFSKASALGKKPKNKEYRMKSG